MLTKDSEMIQEHKWIGEQEKQTEVLQKAAEQTVENEQRGTQADNGVDVTNPEARRGRYMHVNDVIANLKAMNGNLIFEVSKLFPGLMGIYIMEWERDVNTGGMTYGRRYIMAMENGVMPEFTVSKVEQLEMPDIHSHEAGATMKVLRYVGQVRGWRAVLIGLLREGVITKPDIEKHFKVVEGRESRIWHEESGAASKIQINSERLVR